MTEKHVSPQQAMNQIKRIFRKRGTKTLEIAKNQILQEKLESDEVREALTYFANEYWHDLARPSLLSLVCEAVGGDPDVTTPIAIPLTLISGGIDIHDDLIDLSETKNGKATVYGKYGKDIALLVGDALLFKGLTLLSELATSGVVSSEEMETVVKTVKNMFFELGDAESLELQLKGNRNVLPEDYLKIVRKKAADVEAHTRIGALLGGASPEAIGAMGEYGRLLGMLIILRDDWIDVFDPFEAQNRIRNEALPLPILLGLRHPKVKHAVRETLSKKKVTRKDIEAVTEAIDRSDLPQEYMKMMSELAEDAMDQLKKHKIERHTLNLIISSTLMS